MSLLNEVFDKQEAAINQEEASVQRKNTDKVFLLAFSIDQSSYAVSFDKVREIVDFTPLQNIRDGSKAMLVLLTLEGVLWRC